MREKLKTGVAGLDEMFYGGVYKASVTSINGPAGCGKTTLMLHFLVQGAKQKQPGILVSFEQFPEQTYRDALSFGWNLKKFEEKNLLKIVFTSPDVFIEEMESQMGLIDELALKMKAERIGVDPVNYFKFSAENPAKLRHLYNRMVNAFKRRGLTSFLTCETSTFFGNQGEIDAELAFVVDNIIILRYVEIASRIRNAIAVVKARGSKRDKEIREYDITEKGIKIAAKFKDQEGILTGIPRTVAERIAKEFEL